METQESIDAGRRFGEWFGPWIATEHTAGRWIPMLEPWPTDEEKAERMEKEFIAQHCPNWRVVG
jgi:hypothetical protein